MGDLWGRKEQIMKATLPWCHGKSKCFALFLADFLKKSSIKITFACTFLLPEKTSSLQMFYQQ